MFYRIGAALVATVAIHPVCWAQQAQSATDCAAVAPADHMKMDHAAHMAASSDCKTVTIPTLPGQAAFGAISEVVRILEADPHTDWTKVNIEALRQHLIDMDEVTMRSSATQHNIPGGMEVDVTGTGATVAAIRRMTINHTTMLEQGTEYHASATPIPNGARLVVTAKSPTDSVLVARIRGLGFAGIMTEGNHHVLHHLAIARGEKVHGQ
jgi:hypothetical protein